MKQTISTLRQKYRPERIKVLFVAESPPDPADGELRFFYNHECERWDHLYRSLMKCIFPEFEYRPGEKDKWLRKFKDRGFYLIDATDRPVNHLPPADRHKELNSSVERKLREITTLVALRTPIILVKKNVFSAFSVPLSVAGHNVIHESFLPFPSHGHQSRFIQACRKFLKEAHDYA